MSIRSWTERIQDILDAIAEIRSFTREMDFNAFHHDYKTLRAVELNFIIIGEAANKIPESVQENHPEISWHLMRAMRNRLVHDYFEVDPRLVWDTVQYDLPALYETLKVLSGQQNTGLP
jgi:uncharacterized protein with HEPN domain